MKKLSSRWIPRLLTVDQKQQRVDDSERCLKLFQRDKMDFLSSSHENDPFLAPILVRNVTDSRIFATMREYAIPALFLPQILRKFMTPIHRILRIWLTAR